MHQNIEILQLFSYSIYTLVSVASVIVAELFCLYRMIFWNMWAIKKDGLISSDD